MATIVHVANFYGPKSGGLRTAMNAVATEYSRQGHITTLIVPGASDTCSKTGFGYLYEIASPVVPFTGGYRFIVRRNRVAKLIDAFSPDVLEISDRTSLLALAKDQHRRGGVVSMWAHERVDGVLASFFPGSAKLWEMIADLWNAHSSRLVDHVISTTEYAGGEFRRIGVEPHLVPLGVDLRLFAPWKRDDLWKENFNAMPLLLLCSRLSREKNPGRAVEALRNLRLHGLKAHLVIIGDGPLRSELEKASRGLPVSFLGFIPDRAIVARIMASVDVVLAPGPIETFGLAALESLACGTPVVAAKSGAVGEILGEAGICAGDSDVEWSKAIIDVLARKEGARRASARNRAEEFDWSKTVQRLTHIYQIQQEVEDVV